MPKKQVKKRRLDSSDHEIRRRRGERVYHVCAWDFIHDRDESQRDHKNVDEGNRWCETIASQARAGHVGRWKIK